MNTRKKTMNPFQSNATTPRVAGSLALESEPRDGDNVVATVDQQRIQLAVREILLAVGEDPDREGLRDTPTRVARMYAELFSGLHRDPAEHLKKCFTQEYDEM